MSWIEAASRPRRAWMTVFRDPWLRLNLALVGANIVLGLAVSLFTNRERFYLGEIANWLLSRAFPYLLSWGGVKLVTLAAFGEYTRTADALIALTSAFVTLALLGKIADNLRTVGVPIPESLGSRPKPQTGVAP